jgi:hypothetical protein
VLASGQKAFESVKPYAPELAVARNPVCCRLDSIRFEMELMLPTRDPARDEAGTLQYREVLGDLGGRLGKRGRERRYRLVAPLTETREKPSPCRVTEREEDFVEVRLAHTRPSALSRMLCDAPAALFLFVHHMVYCYLAARALQAFYAQARGDKAAVRTAVGLTNVRSSLVKLDRTQSP